MKQDQKVLRESFIIGSKSLQSISGWFVGFSQVTFIGFHERKFADLSDMWLDIPKQH